MGQALSILMDIAVMVCLGVTIFYALKLSKNLNAFRQHRQEMNKLLEMLSKNIDEALRAIDGLKIAGDKSGRELQKVINESKAMANELQMINETANSLASRLEGAAQSPRVPFTPAESEPRKTAAADRPSFFIHDREYNDKPPVPESDDEEIPGNLQSQAERELMDALRKNKKSPGRGAF